MRKIILSIAFSLLIMIPGKSYANGLTSMLTFATDSSVPFLIKKGNAETAFSKGNYDDAITQEKDLIRTFNSQDDLKNDGYDNQLVLALAYLVQGNAQEALKLSEVAASKGNFAGQLLLAGMYAIGQGVKEDKKKAVYWLNEAKKKHKNYPCVLHKCITKETQCADVPNQDPALLIESMGWTKDDMNTRLALGLFYQIGLFTKKKEHKARDLFEKPAKEGNAIAQLLLVQYYDKSSKKDDQKKVAYWRNMLSNNPNKDYVWSNTTPTDLNIATVLGLIYKNASPEPLNNYLFNYLLDKFYGQNNPPLTPQEEADRQANIQFNEISWGIARQQELDLMK